MAAVPFRTWGSKLNMQLFGVFDGHNGCKASQYCKRHVVRELLPRLPKGPMPAESKTEAFQVREMLALGPLACYGMQAGRRIHYAESHYQKPPFFTFPHGPVNLVILCIASFDIDLCGIAGGIPGLSLLCTGRSSGYLLGAKS